MSTARFSLAPPPEGDGNFGAIDIIGVPDLNFLIKFGIGNIGVAQSCFDAFFRRQTAGLDADILDIFGPLAQQNNNTAAQGVPGMETTLIRSVLETQKPYIEAVLSVLDVLVVVEDIIAVLLAGAAPNSKKRSLKPRTNYKSLYTKLNGIRSHLQNVNRQTKPAYSSFKDIPFGQRVNGIDPNELLAFYQNRPRLVEENAFTGFTFVTVSEFYSTGEFIPEVPYDYTYIDIVDQNVPVSVPQFNSPEPRNDDNPPVIIFDIWVDPIADGNPERITNPNLLPNDWDITNKWFGQWDGYTKNVNTFAREYEDITLRQLNDEMDRGGVDDQNLRNQIIDIHKNALPSYSDLYNDLNAGNFKESIYIDIKEDIKRRYSSVYGLKTRYGQRNRPPEPPKEDPIGAAWHNQPDQFGFKPRKLNGNWIDPEVDYELRLVRVFPQFAPVYPNGGYGNITAIEETGAVLTDNVSELSGSNPLVFNYGDDIRLDELLPPEDYDPAIPSFTYPTNGYTQSKEDRAYPPYEQRAENRILRDKVRKSNSGIISKLIVGDLSLRTDFDQVIEDLRNEARLTVTGGNAFSNNILYLFGQRGTPDITFVGQSNTLVARNVTETIINRFNDNIRPALLEAVVGGLGALENEIRNTLFDFRNRHVNEGAVFGFGDFVSAIDVEQAATVNYVEKVNVNGGLPTPDRNYGVEIIDDYYIRSSSLLGGLGAGFDQLQGLITGGLQQGLGRTDLGGSFKVGDLIPRGTGFDWQEDGPKERDILRLIDSSVPPRIEPQFDPRRGGTLQETIFIDKGIFYIIEGVYKNRKDYLNQQFQVSLSGPATAGSNSSTSGERFYKYGKKRIIRAIRSLVAAISKFAQFGGSALPKLIRTVAKALSILKNPFNLIFEIVMEQLGDTFSAFDPDILSKFQQLRTITDNEAKRIFIQDDPVLRNFIALDSEFNYRFVFDGLGIMSVFGQNFGLGIKDILPKITLDINGTQAGFCNERPPDRGGNATGNYDENGNLINSDFNANGINGSGAGSPNRAVNRIPDGTTFEIIDIEYSTGDFIEGVDYRYYYITLDNQDLINRAEDYLDQADKIFDPAEKIRLQLLALEEYQKAIVKDPGNRFLNVRQNEIVSNEGVQVNMMFQFIMNIIMIPIKIVICIIEYIIDFFTNLKVKEIPSKLSEFMKFRWILDFFKPSKVLELLGMRLNPGFSLAYYTQSLNNPPSYEFDASQIFAAPFLGKLPTYSSLQYPNIFEGGQKILLTMSGVFCWLEGAINEILCFLFNILNLDKLFSCPEINLTRFIDDTLSQDDIDALLAEADSNFLNQRSDINGQGAFVFDVELDNGEIVQGLNRAELQAFVASNRNLAFQYNFDRNVL